MTKYIALRMLDVHGRSIIEWHVIDSPGVRWNEVHRFGCVIRLHVNLYTAYCRKNISRHHADTRFNFYYISFHFFLSLILNYFYYRANTVFCQDAIYMPIYLYNNIDTNHCIRLFIVNREKAKKENTLAKLKLALAKILHT